MNNLLKGELSFLTSKRFWVIMIGAIALGLFNAGVISSPVFNAISAIVVGFTGVRTIDRFSEKIGSKK